MTARRTTPRERNTPPDGSRSQLDLFGAGLQDQKPVVPALVIDTVPQLLEEMSAWAEAGWLRWLDVAFGRFLWQQSPEFSVQGVWAAVMLSCLEGHGHTCLEVRTLFAVGASARRRRGEWLAWPAPALEAFERVLGALNIDSADLDSALRGADGIQVDGDACAEIRPLVWVPEGGRLYLRRHWRDEQQVAAEVLARMPDRCNGDGSGAGATAPLSSESEIASWLDRLFPGSAGGGADRPVDWQRVACGVAMQGRLAIITGGPGTGKTYTVARLLALMEATHRGASPLRMALAAPTGKAAARLKQSIDGALSTLQAQLGPEPDLGALMHRIGPARTLHSLLGARPDTRRMARDARHPLDLDVLVVDEASMVHLEMMASLLDALPAHARLILLGDKDQLSSVEAGSVLGDLCRPASALAPQTVMLRESRRFAGAIGRLAVAVNAGDVPAAWKELSGPDRQVHAETAVRPERLSHLILQGRPGAEGGYARYARLVQAGPPAGPVHDRTGPCVSAMEAAPHLDSCHERWVVQVLKAFESFRLLTAVREGEWGVSGLNARSEATLDGAGYLKVRGEWYEGRPVMVTRNDPALGVFNGDVGVTLRPAQRQRGSASDGGGRGWRVYFLDGEQLRSVLASRLHHIETAFAMTVHKSQGSEFEHTVMVLPPQGGQVLTRELVYTGITRARQAFTLIAADPAAFDAALQRRTWRASGLPSLLSTGSGRADEG